MSLFKKIIGSSASEAVTKKTPWILLEELSEIEQIKNASFKTPIAIFKHSTRCSISRMALKEFENDYNLNSEELKLYFLDLLAYRTISNELAIQFNITHQSPQILLIKNGVCTYHVSHDEIIFQNLKSVI